MSSLEDLPLEDEYLTAATNVRNTILARPAFAEFREQKPGVNATYTFFATKPYGTIEGESGIDFIYATGESHPQTPAHHTLVFGRYRCDNPEQLSAALTSMDSYDGPDCTTILMKFMPASKLKDKEIGGIVNWVRGSSEKIEPHAQGNIDDTNAQHLMVVSLSSYMVNVEDFTITAGLRS